jgi:hypothetical protein
MAGFHLSSHLKILPTVDSLRHDQILPGRRRRAALGPVLLLQPITKAPISPWRHRAGLGHFRPGCPRLPGHAMRQLPDLFQLRIDALGERKGIRPSQHPSEGRDLDGICLGARQHAGPRGLGPIIAADQPGAVPALAQQLHRRLKQILEEPQVRIERLERGQGRGALVAIPPDELAHMGPVLLLDVRIVILLIGARPRELNRGMCPLAERPQMISDELTAMVRINPAQRERQLPGDRLQRGKNALMALAPDRVPLDPPGVHVHGVQRVQVLPVGLAPECDTRSISRSPAFVTSHWSVLIGIMCLSSEPGRVVP